MTKSSLENLARLDSVVSDSRSYPMRLISTAVRFLVSLRRRPDLVFAGFFAQPILPFIRLFWSGPLVADGFISLFDSLVQDKGLSDRDGIVAKLAYALDRFAASQATVLLVDTRQHASFYRKMLTGDRKPPIVRLWAGADEDKFRILKPLEFDHTKNGRFEVLFWGGFIPLQGVDVIVRAAAKLSSNEYRVTVVGDGQTYNECRKLADSLGAKSLEFKEWQTTEQLRALASTSHLLLGVFGTTEKAKRVIPNKAFQALALGKPLLTGRSEGIAELLEENKDVILCEMGDANDLVAKIEWVRVHYPRAIQIGKTGFETFFSQASSEARGLVLSSVLESIGSRDVVH